MVRVESASTVGIPSSIGSPARPRSGITVHYVGSTPVPRGAHSQCRAQVRGWHNYHKNGNGWAGIGYHFCLCHHGIVMTGRGLNRSGAHAPPVNSTHIGVLFMVGGGQGPTSAQLRGFREFRDWLAARGVNRRTTGHRDHWSTSCPGAPVYRRVRSGDWGAGGSVPDNPSGGSGGDSRPRNTSDVQRLVNNLGHKPPLAVDGDYGPLTTAGVKWAQRLFGLTGNQVDGIWGPQTEAAYQKHKATPEPAPQPKDFIDVADFIWYSGGPQDLKAREENVVEYDATNFKWDPVVTVVFENKEVDATAHYILKGTPGHAVGIRFAKVKPKSGGGFETVYRFPDTQETIPESGILKGFVTLQERTHKDERMRLYMYPLHSDMELLDVRVNTRQAER